MKLLTIVIPSYNSQDYLSRCIDSMLINDPRLEILIINDGSTDKTSEIADHYANQYPENIRVVHQENKGHGGAINTGIKEATGRYFKVVDSDDWVDQKSLQAILQQLDIFETEETSVDLVINNYVYERGEKMMNRVVNFKGTFPKYQTFKWTEAKHFSIGEVLMMHALTYRTQFLKDIHLELPEHTFYVDNLFVYIPLQKVQSLYYIDVDLYRYFIGREDQSVDEENMRKNIDQQLLVNHLMIQATTWDEENKPDAEEYLIKHLNIVMIISSSLLNQIASENAMQKKHFLWKELEKTNQYVYRKINKKILSKMTRATSQVGIKTSNKIYRLARTLGGY